MTSGIGATNSTTEYDPNSAVKPPAQLDSKETFLKLLVAQIKNQNPMQPADGIEFLSQLSQFSQLEQLMEMRKDLEAIRDRLPEPAQTEETEPAS